MSNRGQLSAIHLSCPLHPSLLFPRASQDHALPVGTDVTDTSLAGILGREREVCVPVTSGIISVNAYDDDDDHDNSNNNASNSSSGSGSSDSSDNNRGWLGQALVLKLRQVNGDGVMSGVWYDAAE